MRKGYNYTLTQDYRSKIYIPYADVTFNGKSEAFLIFSILFSSVATIVVLAIMLKFSLFVLIISSVFAILVVWGLHHMLHAKNEETGYNELWTFYYKHIKRYTLIITQDGEERYIARPYKERRIYVTSR